MHPALCLLQQSGQESEKDVLAVLQASLPQQTWLCLLCFLLHEKKIIYQ